MISVEEFLKTFRQAEDVRLPEEVLKKFHGSIKKSIILADAGHFALDKLLKLEEEWQWPVLRLIGNPNLSVYKGADSVVLNEFINSIQDELKIRKQYGGKLKFEGEDCWIILRLQVYRRIELFQYIFDLQEKEIERCKRAGERFERILKKKREESRTLLKTVSVMGKIGGTGVPLHVREKRDEKK